MIKESQMNTLRKHFSFDLVPGSVYQLGSVQGARIHVAQGQVWLTESGQLDDNILNRGSEYVGRGPGTVVVEALTVARISVEQDARVMAMAKQIARSVWSALVMRANARIAHIHLGQPFRAH
jgi:hypothetical protein